MCPLELKDEKYMTSIFLGLGVKINPSLTGENIIYNTNLLKFQNEFFTNSEIAPINKHYIRT